VLVGLVKGMVKKVTIVVEKSKGTTETFSVDIGRFLRSIL